MVYAINDDDNFDKFRRSFVIFRTNHPDTSVY